VGAIDADDRGSGAAETTVVLLGDLVDRGPDSAGVIAAARNWQARRPVRIIAGNHEEMLLQSLDKLDVLRVFLKFGGRETLLSYPVAADAVQSASFEQLQQLMARAIPAVDLEFIAGFEDAIRIGDYLFVHAGNRPGIALDQQRQSDLRWIREPFLSDESAHGFVVVHGHTISPEVEERVNRIGIDTGAYRTGVLTALGIEEDRHWYLRTAAAVGTPISATH